MFFEKPVFTQKPCIFNQDAQKSLKGGNSAQNGGYALPECLRKIPAETACRDVGWKAAWKGQLKIFYTRNFARLFWLYGINWYSLIGIRSGEQIFSGKCLVNTRE